LAEIGYHIEYGLLNSRFHGVPQNRERIYLVAYRHFRADGGRKIFPVTASDGKALIQLIGGTQGKRVYDPAGISCTLMSEGGGFAGRTGMYFIDLCKGEPRLTEHARCIKARYDSGITNHSGDKSGVLCMGADCPDRTEETALIQLKRGEAKIWEQDYTKCLIAGYNKIGVSNRGESSGVFYGCRAVLTPDRENKRQNGRRFKECGEPAFCLNTQDKHGVYLCACDSCEHALPVKQAADFNKDKSENKSEIPLGCGRIRKLTPRECWRLQGFSDEMFDKAAAVNSDAQLYKQAGNGVTIPVVYAVGKRIVEIQNELNSEVKI
jgi:DNA (cytosine-5)-methyltransferase 1